MNELLAMLKRKTEEIPWRCFFNPPASDVDILYFQIELGLEINPEVIEFYRHFNGGFIAGAMWNADALKKTDIIPSVKWNSNYFLSLDEILSEYEGEGSYGIIHLPDKEEEHGRRLIPIIHTVDQEILVLDATDSKKSGPVIDAFHEAPWHQWGTLYETFEDLLKDYIEKEGRIKTIS